MKVYAQPTDLHRGKLFTDLRQVHLGRFLNLSEAAIHAGLPLVAHFRRPLHVRRQCPPLVREHVLELSKLAFGRDQCWKHAHAHTDTHTT
jgi:hypothetical protein